MNIVEKVFKDEQIITEQFSKEKTGVILFPRYYLYRYYFVKEENMEKIIEMIGQSCENYVGVTRFDTSEFILCTPTMLKHREEYKTIKTVVCEKGIASDMIWWGNFIEDFKFYFASTDCKNKERRRIHYTIHSSTKEKYLLIISLMIELCGCKCSVRYWVNE